MTCVAIGASWQNQSTAIRACAATANGSMAAYSRSVPLVFLGLLLILAPQGLHLVGADGRDLGRLVVRAREEPVQGLDPDGDGLLVVLVLVERGAEVLDVVEPGQQEQEHHRERPEGVPGLGHGLGHVGQPQEADEDAGVPHYFFSSAWSLGKPL